MTGREPAAGVPTPPAAVPDWETVLAGLGEAAADAALRPLLADAAEAGARIERAGTRLRIDLRPAYPDEVLLARARTRLMPHAGRVAALLAQAEGASGAARVTRPEPPPTVTITTDAGLAAAVAALVGRPAVGLDSETTGLDPRVDRLRLVQIGLPDRAYVVDTWQVGDLSPLARLLADPAVRKVGQNLKFDLGFWRQRGMVEAAALYDTMLASQLLSCGEDGATHNLAALARRHLALALDKREQRSDWSQPDLSESQVAYAALDASLLVPLATALERRVSAEGMTRAAAIEMEVLPAVAALEAGGMPVDATRLGRLLAETARARDSAAARARALLPGAPEAQMRLAPAPEPIALSSPAEVARALRAIGLDVPDAREESLARHGDRPEVAAYLEWRHLDKRFAFLDGLARFVVPGPGGSRVYPGYWQIGAATGRMSCSSPNLQQVPRDPGVRALFAAPAGRALVIADYSQIELRIVAALSGDARMRDAFARGDDLHRLTASLLAGKPADTVTAAERQAAKAANFGLVYSMGARGLADYARQGYGVAMSLEEAQRQRERFFQAYPGVAGWHERARRDGEAAGQTRTVAGRVRRFGGRARAGDFYNAPVQGTGADIFKAGLARVWRALRGVDAELGAAVHDEVVIECAASAAAEVAQVVARELRAAAEALVPGVPFPAEAHVGRDWSEK